MKLFVLVSLVAIFTVGGFVITNAYGQCIESDGPPQPCFDSFGMSYEKITEKSMMENYARNIELNYDDWQMSDRNWVHVDSELELPAIICTEFVADGVKQYRMAKWVDDYKISSWEDHYNPSLCDKWLPPIDDGIKVKWDKELYPSEDVAVIQVIDKDMNLDSTIRDVFEIHVWSDIDHGGIQLTVTETENDTGIFYAKVYLTTTNVSSGARLLVEDAINAEHKGNRDFSRIINEPESPHTTNQLDELCKTGQALCQPAIKDTNLIGAGGIDLDPDLSPSYANDFLFSWKSIFVLVPLISGIIAATLLSIHFILKKKNIRSRPYITIISAAIMLYFGTQTLSMLGTIVMFLQQESPWHYLDQIVALLAYPIIGFGLIGCGIIFLYKSQLIRKLIRK